MPANKAMIIIGALIAVLVIYYLYSNSTSASRPASSAAAPTAVPVTVVVPAVAPAAGATALSNAAWAGPTLNGTDGDEFIFTCPLGEPVYSSVMYGGLDVTEFAQQEAVPGAHSSTLVVLPDFQKAPSLAEQYNYKVHAAKNPPCGIPAPKPPKDVLTKVPRLAHAQATSVHIEAWEIPGPAAAKYVWEYWKDDLPRE